MSAANPLERGHVPKVVTVEIRVAAKGDNHAENAILALLAQAKEGTDFNVDDYQVVGIADGFSDEAKAYNAELGEPSWRDADRPRSMADIEADIRRGEIESLRQEIE